MNELAILRPDSQETLYVACPPQSKEEKKSLANAMMNPDYSLSDFINKPIELANVFMEKTEVENEREERDDKGNVVTVTDTDVAIRTVLIDADGKSYACMSKGISNALRHLFAVYGTPSEWEEPITIIPKTVKVGKGQMTTFSIE